MRVFRPSYRSRDGQQKHTATWCIEVRDHLGRQRRFSGFKDKRQSEALGRQIERLVNCRIGGDQPDAPLLRWLETVPSRMRSRFVACGLLDAHRAAAGKPLSIHLDEFHASLRAKGTTAQQARQVTSRARRIIEGCKFRSWTEIQASNVERYLSGLRDHGNGISAQTSNGYLQAIKQFGKWMVADRRATESPVEHLKAMNARTDRRHDRRPLELDEVRRLLSTTQASERRCKMSGHERALLYRLAIETGLRANELRSLKVSSFDLDGCTVSVRAAYSKRRREDTLPLRPDTAAELKTLFTTKTPEARAFNMPGKHKVAPMLRRDLEDTGIPWEDEAGRYADFHALRHTTGSFLAAVGVHPKVAQQILRHSKMDLTMSVYTHTLHGQESAAVAALPDLSIPAEAAQAATGTDGKPAQQHTPKNLARHLARECAQPCISMHSGASQGGYSNTYPKAQKKPLTRPEAAFRGRRTERAGFEPAVGVVPPRRFSKPLP